MELTVQLRTEKAKKLKLLRKQNIVPAIVYGKYIDAPVLISLDKQEFIKAYDDSGYSMPITLKWDGVDQLVLIHEIQVDPVTDYVLHVDFITLKKGQKVETEVQIVVVGVAPVEKLGFGNVQLVQDTVEIEALPKDLPHNIELDISSIETVNDIVFAKDLILGTGVTLKSDSEQAIITVSAVAEDVEEEEEALVESSETATDGETTDDSTSTDEEKAN